MNLISKKLIVSLLVLLVLALQNSQSQNVLSPGELLELKTCSNLQLSPDGTQILYSVSTPRGPNDPQGKADISYWKMTINDGTVLPLFQEGIKGSSPRWSPDGNTIGFLYAEEDEIKQVWAMPSGGGELTQLTRSESDVSSFRWNPGGRGLAFLASTPETVREQELEERGYGFIFYEENLKNTNLYISEFDQNMVPKATRQLTEDVNVWDFEFNRQGTYIAAGISPKNLIDQRYMFKRIHLIDILSGDMKKISENEGKLGNYAFSPDGRHLAYTASLNINDHAVSQVFVLGLEERKIKNLTPEKFRGHINWVGWKNNKNLVYFSGEGVYPKLNLVPLKGGKRKVN